MTHGSETTTDNHGEFPGFAERGIPRTATDNKGVFSACQLGVT